MRRREEREKWSKWCHDQLVDILRRMYYIWLYMQWLHNECTKKQMILWFQESELSRHCLKNSSQIDSTYLTIDQPSMIRCWLSPDTWCRTSATKFAYWVLTSLFSELNPRISLLHNSTQLRSLKGFAAQSHKIRLVVGFRLTESVFMHLFCFPVYSASFIVRLKSV